MDLEQEEAKWRNLLNSTLSLFPSRQNDQLNDYRDVRHRNIPGLPEDQQKALRQQFEVDALVNSLL